MNLRAALTSIPQSQSEQGSRLQVRFNGQRKGIGTRKGYRIAGLLLDIHTELSIPFSRV